MEYEDQFLGATYNPVHNWRPPCDCGVELGEALKVEESASRIETGEVHFWRPPCDCGISLDEVVE